MPFTIKIQPSGKRFVSEGRSTLLEAGLNAGLALNYGCSNGNCGRCLAKIISGDVKKVRHHDYPISQHQRLGRSVLMCSNSAVTDVTLEAFEAGGTEEIPHQQITTRIRNLEIVNDNVALLHLKTPRSNRLRFLAGQKVQLGGGDIPAAEHFISSCPCDDMNLHFQIPKCAGDAFSQYTFNQLNKGDSINISGPIGNFILNENSSNELVFIAWHTGFAPIRSLVENAMALELSQPMHLIWVANNRHERYQHNLCRSWHDAFDNFNYVELDGPLDPQEMDETRIMRLLNINPENLESLDFYLADNTGMTSISTGKLVETG